MDKNTLKIKDGLQLRKIGNRYMIVDTCSDNVNMSNVYSMNVTAADLWTQIEHGCRTVEELTDWLCCQYEVDRTTAFQDVERQLAAWQAYGLLV